MKRLPSLEKWQESLMQLWQVQAGVDGGVMFFGLDDFLTNEARRDFVLVLATRALTNCMPPGRRTGKLFISLIEGRLQTTESDPINYLTDV